MLKFGRRALPPVVLLALCWPAVVLAQGSKAGVVTTLEGRVTAARAALPQPVALKFKDDVFLNDQIVTGDRSIIRLLLGGKALVTVRERSALTITEIPGRSTIELASGKLAVAVEKLQPGETLEVKTPNAVAAVRGTAFVAEVRRAVSVTSIFYGFEGQVLVTAANQTFTLLPNTVLSATDSQPPTQGPMTADLREQALAGLRPRAPQVSAGQVGAKDQAVDAANRESADATVETLGNASPMRVEVPLLPGGDRRLPTVRGGAGCSLPICID